MESGVSKSEKEKELEKTMVDVTKAVIGIGDISEEAVKTAVNDPKNSSLRKRAQNLLATVTGKTALASAIGKLAILPAQIMNFTSKIDFEGQDVVDLGMGHTFYKVNTPHSTLFTCKLDTMENKDPKEKKYIIYFNGNAMSALQTFTGDIEDDKARLSETNTECVFIAFDYPGVNQSTGHSKKAKDLVDAGYAQVQELLKQGVPPENIMLKGQSIGGGVATQVAARLHQENKPVYLFNQRSFSKLSKAAKYMIQPKVFGSIAAFVVGKIGWEMDSVKAWNTIPNSHKSFCRATNDQVIQHQASLGSGIGKSEENVIQNGHNDPLESDDWNRVFLPFVQDKFVSDVKVKNTEIQELLNQVQAAKTKIYGENKGAPNRLIFSQTTNSSQNSSIRHLEAIASILSGLQGSSDREAYVEAKTKLESIKTKLEGNKDTQPLVKPLTVMLDKIGSEPSRDANRRHTTKI